MVPTHDFDTSEHLHNTQLVPDCPVEVGDPDNELIAASFTRKEVCESGKVRIIMPRLCGRIRPHSAISIGLIAVELEYPGGLAGPWLQPLHNSCVHGTERARLPLR